MKYAVIHIFLRVVCLFVILMKVYIFLTTIYVCGTNGVRMLYPDAIFYPESHDCFD